MIGPGSDKNSNGFVEYEVLITLWTLLHLISFLLPLAAGQKTSDGNRKLMHWDRKVLLDGQEITTVEDVGDT